MTDNLRKFCIAPMMGYTTPHARNLYRILSKKTFLFTEMIPSKTMINSEKKGSIIENNYGNPIALQVGGSEYQDLIKKITDMETKIYRIEQAIQQIKSMVGKN